MAKKRANGEGGISRRKDGRWTARYYLRDGTRKTLYAKTKREVAERLARAVASLDEVPVFAPKNVTFGEFLEQYDGVARDTMKRRSYDTYENIARLHLLPAFGLLKLSEVSRERVQRMYSEKRGSGLSAARVRRIHGVLSACLGVAVRWRYLERNVCTEVSPPRVPEPEVRPLDLEESRRFLEAAEEDGQYHALFTLALTCGARWGELTGLFWSDVDLSSRRMWIQRSLVKGKGGYTFDTTKTAGSRRSVTLTRRATRALEVHRERQCARGIATGGDALVFTNTAGSPVNHSHFTRRHFKPLLGRAELPDIRIHDLRHTCCCLLLLEKVDARTICNMMGWSSVSFMLTNYARFMPGWGDNDAMDRILG